MTGRGGSASKSGKSINAENGIEDWMKCPHPAAAEIIQDGEIVCRRCGTVKDQQPVLQSQYPDSRLSLYLERKIGGKPNPSLPAAKYAREKEENLAAVSNIAHKLDLPNWISREVYAWYEKLRGIEGLRLTRAKLLVLAFHGVCKARAHPLHEPTLLDAIGLYLNARRVRGSLKVLMEASKFLTPDGSRSVLEDIGYSALISTENNFFLHSKINALSTNRPPPTLHRSASFPAVSPEVAKAVASEARVVARDLAGTGEQTARVAIGIALSRRGYH